MPGLILSAPSSGSGKTTITLGLLRALYRRGTSVKGAKSGPDYIDPRFHEAACHAPCLNLDAWAMPPDRLRSLACTDDLLLIEGAMGLFDGAPPDGKGSSADLARILALPVILIIDTGRMAQSVAPIAAGFARHDPEVRVAGVILNNVGSPRHETMLRRALASTDLPVLGAVPRQTKLRHPSRHLGLIQAQERPDLDAFLDTAAEIVEQAVDLDRLIALAAPLPPRLPPSAGHTSPPPVQPPVQPPAQRIAVARDAAFAFAYPHMLDDWHRAGAEITPFSPLADDPVPKADLIFLPGGYPELYAAQLSANQTFLQGLRDAAKTTDIYGECGGYMVLGEALTDAAGVTHAMAGLLHLHTSFASRKLHLGYRDLTPLGGPFTEAQKGHEFHYCTTVHAEGAPLYQAKDAEGTDLAPMGLRAARVCGSFAHVINPAI